MARGQLRAGSRDNMTDGGKIAAIPFGNLRIGPRHPVVVIAEIGINHEGNIETCGRLIEAAAAAGADAVKLQTVDPAENYAPDTASFAIYSEAELSREQTAAMFNLARRRGLEIFTTAGDFRTLEWVDRLNPAGHKISSGLLTHLPLIERASRTGRSVLISTGMAETADIDAAVAAARRGGQARFALFQCTSLYPAPRETLNLATIAWLEQRYGAPAGFSDHSKGTEAAAPSVAAGARMIEKHFTLEPSRPGFDHGISLNPTDFAEMVCQIRAVEEMVGQAEKQPSAAERVNAARFRRCLVARRAVVAGAVIDADDIAVMRVLEGEVGLVPGAYGRLVGARAVRDLQRFRLFTEEFLRNGN